MSAQKKKKEIQTNNLYFIKHNLHLIELPLKDLYNIRIGNCKNDKKKKKVR